RGGLHNDRLPTRWENPAATWAGSRLCTRHSLLLRYRYSFHALQHQRHVVRISGQRGWRWRNLHQLNVHALHFARHNYEYLGLHYLVAELPTVDGDAAPCALDFLRRSEGERPRRADG